VSISLNLPLSISPQTIINLSLFIPISLSPPQTKIGEGVLIADPEIQKYTLDFDHNKHIYITLGSDGLWDTLTPSKVREREREKKKKKREKKRESMREIDE
jgi:serine/threonine protein phosphatase PrpC